MGKKMPEVTAKYRGYQTMEAKEHPDVKKANANDLTSDLAYREDYEDTKDMVYFPYTITQEYYTKSDNKRREDNYKKESLKEKQQNKFDVTETQNYVHLKDLESQTKESKYRGEYEKTRGHMFGTDETPEMTRAKELLSIQSKQTYAGVAKAALAKNHVTADGQEIAHASNMNVQASDLQYKAEFKKDLVGKGVADPSIAYPEHDRLKKIADDTKRSNYEKESKEMMKKNIYPPDAPEFIRATQSAKNASDREYQKQKWEVISNYRGYQTMDSRDHPDVTRGQKANDLISDIKYRADYEDSKTVLCFPYTLTYHYDKTQDMQKLKYDYIQYHEKTKSKNCYDVTATPTYAQIKEHDQQTSDIKYKEYFEKNKGKMLGTEETPEMTRAKDLRLISKQAYGGRAKLDLKKPHVNADGQEIAHASNMTVQASDLQYKADYKKDQLGKGVADPAIAYPEHDRLKKIKDSTKKSNYEKESKEIMKKNIYPPDAPEFLRAIESAKNASDKEYQKQKWDVIIKYRGYQTMDSRDHPDVTRGQKANDLISEIKYRADYEDSKVVLCFPYTLTDQYDTTQAMQKLKYDYVQDYQKSKTNNHYDVTDTPSYTEMKLHNEHTSEVKYKEAYENNKGKMLGTEETPEMSLAMELKPFQSKQAYEGAAKAALIKHHVDGDDQKIAHAQNMTVQASDLQYKADYKNELVGKGVADPAIAYPEHDRLKKIAEETKTSNYQK